MLALNTKAVGCLGVVVLGIVALVGAFDALIATNFVRQRHAQQSFVRVQGEVLRSSIKTSTSSSSNGGGTTHRAVVEYAYEVNDTHYKHDRYSFVQMATNDRAAARTIVDRHPPGAPVTVHHDPDDPQNAVLDLSQDAFDAKLFLFMLPFNCFAIGVIRVWLFALRHRDSTPEDAALSSMVVSRSDTKTVLRDQRWGVFTVFLITLGASGFAATFVVLFGFGGFNAPNEPALVALGACGALALLVSLRHSVRIARSTSRLVIDYADGTFERLDGSGAHKIVSIKRIDTKSVPRSKKASKKNREAWFTHSYIAVLERGDKVLLLTSMGHKDQRRHIKSWIESRLGLSDA